MLIFCHKKCSVNAFGWTGARLCSKTAACIKVKLNLRALTQRARREKYVVALCAVRGMCVCEALLVRPGFV